MKKNYCSNAKWTKIKDSKDTHNNKGMADAVCYRLLEDYGAGTTGCEIRGHCLKTWVTEEDTGKI